MIPSMGAASTSDRNIPCNAAPGPCMGYFKIPLSLSNISG
jgi:hypothetical protein